MEHLFSGCVPSPEAEDLVVPSGSPAPAEERPSVVTPMVSGIVQPPPQAPPAVVQLQDQLLTFQRSIQGQMQALVTWVANSQPTIAPSLVEAPLVARPAASVSAPPDLGAPAPSVPVQSLGEAQDETCVKLPVDAPAPRLEPTGSDLPPPSLVGALEDNSPPPSMLGSSVYADHPQHLRDPFEDSSLRGFGLSSVGAALSVRPVSDGPSDRESSLWALVRTGGEGRDRPRRIPRDKTEKLYRQEEGLFAPPVWPSTLPVGPRAVEEDRLLKDLQLQWGMVGLAVARGLVRLEATIKDASEQALQGQVPPTELLASLQESVNAQVGPPLAHALRMTGGYFNDLSVKRRRKLARAIKDSQLSKWLDECPESTTSLFAADVAGALDAARARRTDGLLSIASRAARPTATPASSSAATSARGHRFEPYAPVRRPFRGARLRATSFRGRLSSSRGRGSSQRSSASSRDVPASDQ